jgi:Predicted peptidase
MSMTFTSWAKMARRGTCIGLGAALAFLGCRKSGGVQRNGPHPLESKMEAATFSPPSAKYPLPYRLYVPKGIKGKAPLIVSLHSVGGRGSDNVSQLGPDIELLISHRVQKAWPAFVLAPQCPAGDEWINRHTSPPFRPYDLSQFRESEANRLTVALVNDLIARHPIDASRVYVMGFSMGGSGAWDMLMRHPGVFAAGIPITGVGDVSRASLLADTSIWAFHGELDEVSPARNGRLMFEALKKYGKKVRYTEYKGVGHGSVGPALEEPELFPWLFAQRRPDRAGEPKSTESGADGAQERNER